MLSCKTRVIGRKLDCLNPNPQRCKKSHSLLQRLQRSALGGRSFSFRDRPPPTERAMKNDFIEGDEWGA